MSVGWSALFPYPEYKTWSPLQVKAGQICAGYFHHKLNSGSRKIVSAETPACQGALLQILRTLW